MPSRYQKNQTIFDSTQYEQSNPALLHNGRTGITHLPSKLMFHSSSFVFILHYSQDEVRYLEHNAIRANPTAQQYKLWHDYDTLHVDYLQPLYL